MEHETTERPARRSEHLIVQRVDQDAVVYDRDTDQVTALTGDDSRVWDALDGTRGVEDVATELALPEHEVAASLLRLDEAKLLDGEVSRRSLMKKVALGGAAVGAISLAGIIAPTAAMADTDGFGNPLPTPSLSLTASATRKVVNGVTTIIVTYTVSGSDLTASDSGSVKFVGATGSTLTDTDVLTNGSGGVNTTGTVKIDDVKGSYITIVVKIGADSVSKKVTF